MKKRALLLPVIGLSLLLAACGQQNSSNSSSSSSSHSENVSSSSSSSSSSKSSSTSSSSSSASNSQSDSTSQSAKDDGFNTTKNGNTTKYTKDGQDVATYTKTNEASESAAANDLQYYNDPSENKGLPTVDLGHGITGAKDAGAGQLYINFAMGRWSLTVHGENSNESAAVSSAKNLNDLLQGQSLPVPNSKGAIMLSADGSSINIQWQDGTTVNTITSSQPDNAIKIAASLR